MVVIIRSPDLIHESNSDAAMGRVLLSEVFGFNHGRLKITFKGSHHLHQTKDDVAMVVKLTDVSAIAKLLTSRGIPFSTEHVKSEEGVKYVSPQISLTSEFVTNPDTDSLEQEVDMLIDVIDKNRNIHDLMMYVNQQVFSNYARQMQIPPRPYNRPSQISGYQYPSHPTEAPGPGAWSNLQQQSRDPRQYPGWDRE